MTSSCKLGKGAYGTVYRAPGKTVIKRNFTNSEISFSSCIREPDILSRLGHPFIIHLRSIKSNDEIPQMNIPMSPNTDDSKRDDNLLFVFQEANCDLLGFLMQEVNLRNKQKRDYNMIISFMVQLLLGVEHLHNNVQIIHRDIKLQNILYFAQDNDNKINHCVKLADFGLAKPFTYQGQQTKNVVTHTYRAPEVILNNPHYDYLVDLWSLGCIFFELISLYPYMSNVSDDPSTLISTIYGMLEKPMSTKDYQRLIVNNKYCSINIINSLAFPKKRTSMHERLLLTKDEITYFEQQTGHKMLSFVDLLKHMLDFENNKRFTATQCLDHPFFASKREYIAIIREKFSPKSPIRYLYITPCFERQVVAKLAMQIYELRNNNVVYLWYTPRILFQALDMFDRYLYLKYSCDKNFHYSTDRRPHFFDIVGTQIRFITCLYLCYKYFLTLKHVFSFNTFMSSIVGHDFNSESSRVAELFESELLYYLSKSSLYYHTIYEATDYFSFYLKEKDIANLLKIYLCDDKINNCTVYQVFNYYIKYLKDNM